MTRKVHKSISDAGQIEGVNTIEKVVLPVEPKANHNINPSAKRRHRISGHRVSPTSTSFWTSSATYDVPFSYVSNNSPESHE